MGRLLACAIVVAVSAAELMHPADAQQQPSTITLSCDGTNKLTATAAADLKPDPITKLGIIVNLVDRTGGVKLKPFTINGSIDRVDRLYYR